MYKVEKVLTTNNKVYMIVCNINESRKRLQSQIVKVNSAIF